MGDFGSMNGDFFAIVWLLVFAVVIIASIWLVRAKKKRVKKQLDMLSRQFANGELNEMEYETKKRKILQD